MRILIGFPAVAGLLYVAVVAFLYLWQTQMVFPASPLRASAREAGLAGFTDIVVETADGERLLGWWRPPEPGRALFLYLHGNGGSLYDRRERARLLTRDGRGLLIVSYRGYSGSTGSPSETGLHRDAEAMIGFLGSYQPERIVLYGESIGSGVAVRLAAHHRVAAVILDSPFTSLADIAQHRFPFVPVAVLLRHPFRSVDHIRAIGAPLLVLHGERDAVVPIAFGERLFAAAPEPKRFVRLPGADHSGVLLGGGLGPLETFVGEAEARYRAGLPREPAPERLQRGEPADAGPH